MTPIEAMAKAYIEAEPFSSDWETAPAHVQEPILAGLRAAVLALAESPIPMEAYRAADKVTHGGNATEFLDIVFKTVLRTIAEESPHVSTPYPSEL